MLFRQQGRDLEPQAHVGHPLQASILLPKHDGALIERMLDGISHIQHCPTAPDQQAVYTTPIILTQLLYRTRGAAL